MERNNFRVSHVAQQSRRDKLRVQEQKYDNLENLSVQQELTPDLILFRNLKYCTISYDHPPMFSSKMVNYATKNSQGLLPQNNSLVSADNVTIARVSGDPHNCSSCDWNFSTYFGNPTSINESNPMFAEGEDGGSDSLNANSNFACSLYMRQPNFYGYDQDVMQSSLVPNPLGETSIIHQNSQKHFGEMQQCSNSSSFNYQNTLEEVVTSVGNQGRDMARFGKDSNELLLLSSFGDHQSNHIRASNSLVDRPVEAFRNWDGEGLANKTIRDRMRTGDTSNTQGLSLSLSSVPPSKTREGQFGERIDLGNPLDSKALRSNYLGLSSKQSVGNKGFGYNSQNIQNGAGPLGPFTGYATVLKNSRYLKPTLQLLDELHGFTSSKQIKTCKTYSDEILEQVEVSHDVVNVAMVGAKVCESGASSSTFYSSNEISGEARGGSSSIEYCYRPEYHQRKETLLYMQGEVSRSCKQYHQQMQMVVSLFESVAGLNAATPYISVALKTVSRQFHCLENAISDQLKQMGKPVTEDLSSPTAGRSSNRKGDTKFNDHGFQKQNSGGSNLVFFEPQPPVWRPQRGLPKRAVAVLRAWLFDNFLHPYPTDTDKHILATQTGLTRNQVSNWFINARVRIWKPMVEEIHILETKSLAEPSSQTGKAHENPAFENASHQYENQRTINLSEMDSSRSRDGPSAELWNQEKRSRVECQIPCTIDQGSLMSFIPYQLGGFEIGTGLGAVSLTLGLRQSAESAHQLQHQQLQQQEHYRQHFGGQMIHDFVG